MVKATQKPTEPTTEYLTFGRAHLGENVTEIHTATSFEEAAKMAARSILSYQHESYNDTICIDLVTDKNFDYRDGFEFEADDLRK